MLLTAIGEDRDRPGLRDTPRRVAEYWREFIEYDAGNVSRTFDVVGSDQMVVVSGVRVWSMCEHHLLPFWCDVSMGYVAHERLLGLSKFARIANQCAHRLQTQEQLVEQIAQQLTDITGTRDVAVYASGEHLCMTARGIRSPHRMSSSAMHGAFLHNGQTRAEFFNIINMEKANGSR